MRYFATLACAALISTAAEAQVLSRGHACSVAAVDTARYGGGTFYRDCEVDHPAKLKRAPRPRFVFPQGLQELRCAIVELEFGVDEEGRPIEATALVVNTNAPEFAQLTLRGLSDWRYEPATKGGVAVRQAVVTRVARRNDNVRVPFVVPQPDERRPRPAPEPPCR